GQRSLLEHPEKYAYSRFEDNDFLLAWQGSRQQALAQLPLSTRPLPEAVKPVCKTGQVDLDHWLAWWLKQPLQAKDFKTSGLHQLIRRFEVSKKLRHSYYLPEFSKAAAYSRDPDLYALFALVLLRFFDALSGPSRWIPANALLKVNDLLVSELPQLGAAAGWVRLSLEGERDRLA
ncbi:MAG: hypothetical protein Q8P12_07575, partial [bacterium]|nr:hypothetical protein [bacterium]